MVLRPRPVLKTNYITVPKIENFCDVIFVMFFGDVIVITSLKMM